MKSIGMASRPPIRCLNVAIQKSSEGSVAQWMTQVSGEVYKFPAITADKVYDALFT